MRNAGIAILLVAALAVLVGFSALRAVAGEGCCSEKHASNNPELPFKNLRVAVLTGEGFQDAETLSPMAFLANRGAKVTVIGVKPAKVTAYNSSIQMYIHKSVADVAAKDFDVLVLPGGHAPAEIRKNDRVLQFTREFAALGKPIAAICHGPQVLVTAGLVEGREMTCFSGMADELRDAGARYRDEAVVRDGKLITSRVPRDIPEWLSTIEEVLKEE